jgi:hypothetical protein
MLLTTYIRLLSPETRDLIQLVGRIAIVIFLTEAAIMLTMSGWMLEPHNVREGLLDATALTVVTSPLIYYWVARPFVRSERLARTELAERLRQQSEQAQTLSVTLEKVRGLLAQNEILRSRLQESHATVADINERTLQRIGADLHDGPAQLLSYSLLRLSRFTPLIASCGCEKDRAELKQMRSALSNTLSELRTISSGLSLPGLQNATLADTISMVIELHQEQTGTNVEFELSNLPECVPQALKACVYRFVQEALNNAYRHAGAMKQQVHAACNERLTIIVSDRGPGFAPEEIDGTGLGLTGMRARISALGGSLQIKSDPQTGSRLTAQFDAKNLTASGS